MAEIRRTTQVRWQPPDGSAEVVGEVELLGLERHAEWLALMSEPRTPETGGPAGHAHRVLSFVAARWLGWFGVTLNGEPAELTWDNAYRLLCAYPDLARATVEAMVGLGVPKASGPGSASSSTGPTRVAVPSWTVTGSDGDARSSVA